MSAIGVTQVQSVYTQASPLTISVGQVSSLGEASYSVRNIGDDVVWCRLNNTTAATSTGWARTVPGQHAMLSIDGVADQALTIDMYQVAQSYRFIPMHDTTYEPVPTIGRVEVTRHGN